MKTVKDKEDWKEGDDLWDLLGKSPEVKGSDRFVDDAVRAVKLLPEADAWWPRVLRFSPIIAVAACLMLGLMFLMNGIVDKPTDPVVVGGDEVQEVEESWVEIEEAADAEMLAAAADHLDQFSDQELASLIGF